MASSTISRQFDQAKGRPSGFDYLRISLATMVVIIHAPIITLGDPGGDMVWHSPLLPVIRLIIPMFFALSGFLVASSFERTPSLYNFFGLRIIRIGPALFVETLLSALILGPLLTEYPLKHYFTDPLFFNYFKNIVGDPQFHLPGLFSHTPNDLVNFQLWTIPFELECYLLIGLVGLLGGRRYRVIAPIAMAVMIVGGLLVRVMVWHDMPEITRPLPGPLLVMSFIAGVSVYLYRERLSSGIFTIISLIIVNLVILDLHGFWQFFAPITIAWLVGCIGTLNPRRLTILRGADYSYGLYLYGYPIEQTVVYIFPHMLSPVFTAVTALIAASFFAAFSWHFVEKPALKLKTTVGTQPGLT
jgi:peptidoglycan/LPS O-acetylase OafA/YrhL